MASSSKRYRWEWEWAEQKQYRQYSTVGAALKSIEQKNEPKPGVKMPKARIGKFPDVKIGDLICYNAGGMKDKTLGLVLEVTPEHKRFDGIYAPTNNSEAGRSELTIQWAVVGKWMPRRSGWDRDPIRSGDIVKHQIGTWFEVVR